MYFVSSFTWVGSDREARMTARVGALMRWALDDVRQGLVTDARDAFRFLNRP